MPRLTLTRAKACGWVPGGAAFPCQGPLTSTGQGRNAGGCMASKAVVLKRQGGYVCRVHLPLDPLLFVCATSTKGSSLSTLH